MTENVFRAGALQIPNQGGEQAFVKVLKVFKVVKDFNRAL
jgi:hypothetical protein